ncbi:Unknown protein sequence [Pseudomonas coronafaciens pv. oryzae]|nr:Unknown protein sequence [Pseudomonas coronafaciens pv. oryzae]
MGDVMEGAMQHAPQSERQSMTRNPYWKYEKTGRIVTAEMPV